MYIKCLLVDDEPPALKVLETYVQSLPNLELVATCRNALEAMRVLNDTKVDLIVLDIKMPMLLGTEFIRTLKNPPKVIFTTAHREFALEGFELEAVDYLLKPVSFERFLKAVFKIFNQAPLFPGKYPDGDTKIGSARFLYFRVDRKMVKVNFDDILFIESVKDYVRIVRQNQKPILVKQSIRSVADMLPENLFLRIHRSFIVAIEKMTAFTSQDVEIGTHVLPVGKLYSSQFKKIQGSG